MSIPTEHQEQVAFVEWFRRQFPTELIFAIPNGGQRNVIVAKKLKAEGVVRGVPDLYVPSKKIWIEMKRQKGGSLSPHQKEIIMYLESIGDTVIVGRGFLDAQDKYLSVV